MIGALVVVGVLAVVLAAGIVVLAVANSRLKVQFDETHNAWFALRELPLKLDAAVRDAEDARRAIDEKRKELASTHARLTEALTADKQKADWLDHQEKEIAWYKQEFTKRPKLIRRTYKILTLGVSGTGKTALTLKWANPLIDLGTLRGTKVERYERTVSHVQDGDELVQHVFEVRDWGGEHIVDALQELMMDEIHGLLFVVDLATGGGATVDLERIQQQLREFRAASLRFFFGPRTLATCQSVVLFINKSDVLSGAPAEVEREARSHFQPLIEDLERYQSQLDVRVLVGSATYGHSTHHLFAHFVGRILPETAYDQQLLQRMKMEGPTDSGVQSSSLGAGGTNATTPVVGPPPLPVPRAPAAAPSPPPLPRSNAPAAPRAPLAGSRAAPAAPVVPIAPRPAPAISTHTEVTPHVERR